MVDYIDQSIRVSPNQRAGIVLCLLTAAVLSGCGGGMTPEQKQAIIKLQGIGGRVNFKGSGCKVDMTKTPVEDKDLVHLRNIPHLVSLDLEGTRITDAGLEHLRSIESLETVSLQRSTVTPEGVEQLRKAMPKTEVTY
jgi:internalin A